MSRSCKQLQFRLALMTHNSIVSYSYNRNAIANIYLNISNSKDGRLLDKLVQFALKQFGADHGAGRPQWVAHHILHPDFRIQLLQQFLHINGSNIGVEHKSNKYHRYIYIYKQLVAVNNVVFIALFTSVRRAFLDNAMRSDSFCSTGILRADRVAISC